MDDTRLEQIEARLKRANAIVEKLAPEIRADAFAVLRPYVEGDLAPSHRTPAPKKGLSDRAQLLEAHGGSAPVDNVLLATAVWYSEYGSSPFTQDDIRTIIEEGGLTGPVRLDRTFDTTTKGKGRSLFRKVGPGRWVPSVPGETYFKETFGVSKGRAAPKPEKS